MTDDPNRTGGIGGHRVDRRDRGGVFDEQWRTVVSDVTHRLITLSGADLAAIRGGLIDALVADSSLATVMLDDANAIAATT